LRLIVEPGHSLPADSAALLLSVQAAKQTGSARTLVMDGGMNALPRPALYDAYHRVLPLQAASQTAAPLPTHVAGPVCESADYLARERELPPLQCGDLLAVMDVGAYGYSMASHYNAHPRPAEVLVEGDSHRLIRRRESYADLDIADVKEGR
jgi:diaminopimelate decarboxylase